MKRGSLLAVCFTISLWVLVACSSQGEMTIENVQANLTLPTETGAVYMTITNETGDDDALVSAAVPGCDAVELHHMVMEGDVMVMQEVPGGEIPIPAGETVELKQGGLHVMCIGKSGQFEIGDTVEVTLEFENAGETKVTAQVIAPGEMGMGNMESGQGSSGMN